MVSLPTYRIEAPDTLFIELLQVIPRPPYRIEAYDVLQIQVAGTMVGQPINGYYLVEGEGIVTLGPAYGTVRIMGMTIDEATEEITRQLQVILQHPAVSVQFSRSGAIQMVTGLYPVASDGTVNLRRYGMVRVAGKTVTEARLAVQQQLAQYFESPRVGLDIRIFNSKKYYVITAGAGTGDMIQPFPIMGTETVLDAIARLQGMSQISSKTMWVARATPADKGDENILPVNFVAITYGMTETNYQLMPGDRLYIVDDNLVAANNFLNKLTQPIERLLNISNLGIDAVRSAQTTGRLYNLTRSGI